MTKKINNIVFYDFEDAFGPHTQVCVFYEDGTAKNMSEEEGELAKEVLAHQLGIEQEQLIEAKKLHHITGEELEHNFQTYKKSEQKGTVPEKETLGQKLKKKLSKDTKEKPVKKATKKVKETRTGKKPFRQRVLAKIRNSVPLAWAVAVTEIAGGMWEKVKKKVSSFFSKKNEKEPEIKEDKQAKPVSPWQEEFDEFQQKQAQETANKAQTEPTREQPIKQANKDKKIKQILESEQEKLAKSIVEAMAKRNTSDMPKVATQK